MPADQADAFRRLNVLVKQTHPAPATLDLIAGMYTPAVEDPHAVANDDYIPSGWLDLDSSQDGKALYRGVVKHGCRTCHVSSSKPALDFLEGSDFAARIGQLRHLVCAKTRRLPSGFLEKGHAMPQAEQTSKVFWASGGRALLLSYTQSAVTAFSDPDAACEP